MALKTSFQLKRSTTASVVPTTSDLAEGELGINLVDKKLYVANSSAVFQIAGNGFPAVEVANNNTLIGKQPRINFIAGTNITLAITEHVAGSQVNVQITASGGGTPAGSNTFVQFNDSGAFGGVANLTFDKTTAAFSITNADFTSTIEPSKISLYENAYNSLFTMSAENSNSTHGGATFNGLSFSSNPNANSGFNITTDINILGNAPVILLDNYHSASRYGTASICANYNAGPYVWIREAANDVTGEIKEFFANGGSIFLGNTTVNVFANSTSLKISNSTSNAFITIPSAAVWAATNYFLHANGSWVQVTSGSGTPGGANTQLQFNDSGAFGADANLSFDKATATFIVGNSTINAIANSTTIKLSNSTSNTTLTIPSAAIWAATYYFLHANGSWVQVTGGSGSPGGANTEIQFNDSGSFGSNVNLSFDKATTKLTVGNSTINIAINSVSAVFTGNARVNSTAFEVGNTTVNTYISSTLSRFTSNVVMSNSTLDYPRIKSFAEETSAPTISGGSLTLDLNVSNIFNVNLNNNITTLTISNAQASGNGVSFVLIFTADGTGRTVSWPGSVRWANGSAPSITSTNNKRDMFVFITLDGGSSYNGLIAGQNF
jgi:hypothetical protein